MYTHPFLHKMVPVRDPAGALVSATFELARTGTLPPATRLFLKHQVLEPLRSEVHAGPLRDGLRAAADRIQHFMEFDLRPHFSGLFLVAGPTLLEAVPVPLPLRNFIYVGRTPYLAPLLEAMARAPRVIVVRADTRDTTIHSYGFGEWLDLDQMAAEGLPQDAERALSAHTVTSRGAASWMGAGIGGGKRDRFAQVIEDAADAMLAHAAHRIVALDAADRTYAILVFCERERYTAFHDHLPVALRERTLHLGAPPHQGDALRHRVQEQVERMVAGQRAAEVSEFHKRREQACHVAFGAPAVLEHLASGKVARVYLDAEAPIPGLKCPSCGICSTDLGRACPLCHGELAPVSLTEEVVRHALAHPPLPLTWVERLAPWLRQVDGMAALLSQKGIRNRR